MKVRDLMTGNLIRCQSTAPISEAARLMRDHNIGDVVVSKNGKACGIVTDRDIVVRALAEHMDPDKTDLDAICTRELITVSPDQSTAEAVTLMKTRAIRRVAVKENGDVVGILSLGDLALQLDRKSALADISAAPPTH
jgi:signal-transduction protein with cAMP-binding, CBS, and nucleotidyltransferase domain